MAAIGLFVGTLLLILWRPKGLGIGYIAMLGGAVGLLTGIISFGNLWVVWQLVWNPTLTFLSLVTTVMLLERAGFFRWGALHVARFGRGSSIRLFPLVVLLGACISAFFANDGAALMLTPIVLSILLALGWEPKGALAFVLATGFVADATSLPLITSNLTNILSAQYFSIPYDRYALVMVPVDVVALGATLLCLQIYFRRDLNRRYRIQDLPAPKLAIQDKRLFRLAFPVLTATLLAYFLTGADHVPISAITGAGALVLMVASVWPLPNHRAWRWHQLRGVIREAPWQVILFSIGMYVVVFGLRNAGLLDLISESLLWLSHGGIFAVTLGLGSLSALLSAILNNLPAILMVSIGIHDASLTSPTLHEAAVYANIVGCDLGPKMTPIGSLATLLWLHSLASKGERISWRTYLRFGLIVTPPVLIVTLLGLAAWLFYAVH